MTTKEDAQRLKQIAEDAALIERLGGPAVLARRLMLKGPRAASRVQNWAVRGIPPSIKCMYPEIFLVGQPRIKGGHARKEYTKAPKRK